MIGLKAEAGFEVSNPLAVGNRTIHIVSRKLCLTSDSHKGLLAVHVSPIYVIVLEQKLWYGLSIETGKPIDLDQLFQENPMIKNEFWKTPPISIDDQMSS